MNKLTVQEIIREIEKVAPPVYQENYDNSGLQTGNPADVVGKIILALDVTEAVVDEAIQEGANLIISHHPVIFNGIKKLTGKSYAERVIIKAIQSRINIYSCHTNLDNLLHGVNFKIAGKLGILHPEVLRPLTGTLCKLVTFVPASYATRVREAIFEAGAGQIGNYDECSYNITGEGTFRALEGTNPFVGKIGELHTEKEIRIETILPKHLENKVVSALLKAHPYEEVAYDVYPLLNSDKRTGAGLIGDLASPVGEAELLKIIKNVFDVPVVRCTQFLGRPVNKIALCGGSGSFLLPDALRLGADMFISADFKYHQFFDAENRIVIADIGHFESEQFTLEIFYEVVTKKLPNFAIYFTKVKTNPINYI